MEILDYDQKRVLLQTILELDSFLGKYDDYDGVLTFLSKIWDLKDMPSEDSRFRNAYDDIYQHIVNNDDWTFQYLFEKRLRILEDDNKFILFVETVVNPTVRINLDDINTYVSIINQFFYGIDYRLILSDYFEELPVYKFKNSNESSDLPIGIVPNKIPIYLSSYDGDKEYPCFIFKYNNWDDYGAKTTIDVEYRVEVHVSRFIGRVKIMKTGFDSIWENLPNKFYYLDDSYCSLGQDENYYEFSKEVLGSHFMSFLLAIRDVAFFPRIHENFENDDTFRTSLTRDNEVERLSRHIRYQMEGINPAEYFKFNYKYKPPYSEVAVALNFDFQYNTPLEHRIYAVIGKNGTGKTNLLSSLAKKLSEKDSEVFTPRKPVFGKVFTVSYSVFDKFEIPNSDASFNYVYCGLKKINNEWKSEQDLHLDFLDSVKRIKVKSIENEWYEILRNFISSEILSIAFHKKETDGFFEEYRYEFSEEDFKKIKNMLSSGQSIILYLVSEIVSKIRFDSLILFDEPETHLHPNAISTLINTLFSLAKKYRSFCILGTHSPLIVQEIPARNIFILDREENEILVRGLERESLGENLTIITQEIFNNKEIPKHFISTIEELVSKGKTYKDIVSILETDQLPITSNIRLYIKALLH